MYRLFVIALMIGFIVLTAPAHDASVGTASNGPGIAARHLHAAASRAP